VPGWEEIPNLVHGFCGRRGGVSRGPFAELNLSFRVDDTREAVRENWRRVVPLTGETIRFATMQQVHGDRMISVERPGDAGEADGLSTAVARIALTVLTADCVPILFVASGRRVVAAVHAGWRGTVAGIAARAVQYFERTWDVAAADIAVALGPAIGGCCYEVTSAIVDALEERWGQLWGAVDRRGGGKAMLDLRRANMALLRHAGILDANIACVGPCTRCTTNEYFSHRAARGATGRQLSFIAFAT